MQFCKGCIVLRKDLLGIVVDMDETFLYVTVEDSDTPKKIYKKGTTLITNPYALTALMFNKIVPGSLAQTKEVK